MSSSQLHLPCQNDIKGVAEVAGMQALQGPDFPQEWDVLNIQLSLEDNEAWL